MTVLLSEDEELFVGGEPMIGEHNFGVIAERAGVNAPFANAVVEVAERDGHDSVRPRHLEHDLVVNFRGTPRYPPSPTWVGAGRFLPFDMPRDARVGATLEGPLHVHESPTQVELKLEGSTHRLAAFNGEVPGSPTVLFADATSGVTTYGAIRALALKAPDAERKVTVDFNRATNLPCAYTDLATLPLPHAENRLSVAIEAGEKIPFERL